MTRFEKELCGMLGAYWKQNADNELKKIRADLAAGKITIDDEGVARNCIGRVLHDDMAEKVAYVTSRIDVDATAEARAAETAAFVEEYRKNARPASDEQLAEMRAAFGHGVVVDVLSGQRFCL